jgi:serine/threonine protein kinase
MERCDMSLHVLAHERDCDISPAQAEVILHGVAQGMQFLHSRFVVHRDIKPRNVLLACAGSKVKLADFGLAKLKSAGATSTATGATQGTYTYMAPEVMETKPRWTNAADVYAFAVTAWETLHRTQPWSELGICTATRGAHSAERPADLR